VDFSDYQAAARRTENAGLDDRERLLDAAAGLAEESGEVLGAIRKHLFQARPLDREAVVEELGDALWCLTTIATSLGVSLGEVAAANVAKLRERYSETRSEVRGQTSEEERRNSKS
jgi:NTP pyrophosphatase (non-canonical NTP hydrolase)